MNHGICSVNNIMDGQYRLGFS